MTNPDSAHSSDPQMLSASNGSKSACFWFWGIGMILLSLGGCLAVYNALYYYKADAAAGYVHKQLLYLGAGLILYVLASRINFSVYRKISFPLLLLQIVLLAGVLFFGKRVNGMRGWYDTGFFYIQPSELAKCTFLLYISTYCGTHKEMTKRHWCNLFFWTILTLALILFQPDFGSCMIFFGIFVLCIFLKGIPLHYLFIVFTGMILSATLFLISNEYALKRILTFLNPEGAFSENAWHIRQFQYTLAHGSWTGAPWGSALWSGAFLPLPHTDSLFASIVEGTGFLGGMLVTLLFIGIAFYFCKKSWEVKAPFEDRQLFIFCAGAITAVQGLLHISVNTILLPPTGVTLPFLSYGGSSLLAQMLLFGIAVSAIRKKEDL